MNKSSKKPSSSKSLRSPTPSLSERKFSPSNTSASTPAKANRQASEVDDSLVTLSNLRPDGERMIREARLMRFENRTQVRKYEIEFTCPEFTCVCPASGFPDFATLTIRYIPKKWCVELKSLKLYINQYRDRKIFHEDVCNVVLDDLIQLLDPYEMEVIGDFSVRGNIRTVIKAKHVHSEA